MGAHTSPTPSTHSPKPKRRHLVDCPIASARFQALQAIPGSEPYRFDIHIGEDVRARAASQPEQADWFRKRMNVAFKKLVARGELEAVPAFDLAAGIVSQNGPRLHFHAIVAVPFDELDQITAAIRSAAGKWPKGSPERQVYAERANAGAPLYLHRNAREARLSGLVHGKTFVSSNASRIAGGKIRKDRLAASRASRSDDLLVSL